MGGLKQTVVAAFGFVAVSAAALGVAQAQTSTALVSGGSIVDNGWTISLSSFTITMSQNGVTTGTCAITLGCSPSSGDILGILANDVLQVVNTGRDVSFVLASSTPGNNLVSFTNTGPGIEKVDINYTVSMTQVAGGGAQNLNSISLAVQGSISGNTTPYNYTAGTGGIRDGASVSYDGANGTSGTIGSLTSDTTTGVIGPVTFTPSTHLTISQDVALFAPPSSTLILTSNPTNAPEPATLAILAPAVLTMIRARKSRKRLRA